MTKPVEMKCTMLTFSPLSEVLGTRKNDGKNLVTRLKLAPWPRCLTTVLLTFLII